MIKNFIKINLCLKLIFLAVLLLTNSGCGPKVITSNSQISSLRKIAVLPPKTTTKIARERIEILQNVLIGNLTARGFQATELSQFCSEKDCQNFQNIEDYSNPDAVAVLEINSSNSANILAGHYYSISGKLTLLSADGSPLISIEHTESNKGGLLFNSGQILEGIESTANALEDDFFPNLANKFTKTIVAKLPGPQGQIANSEISISNTTVKNLGSGKFSICADSLEAKDIAFKNGRVHYPLRKISDKTFCATYLADREIAANKKLQLTATNLYGQSKTISLSNPLSMNCNNSDIIVRQSNHIAFDPKSNCKDVRISVFSANMASGPFIARQRSVSSANKIQIGNAEQNIISVIASSDNLATPEQLLFK